MGIESEFNLSNARVTIVGLGLMGGSLALALRGKCLKIFGIEPNEKIRELALKENIVDVAEANIEILIPKSDIVILAAPVPQILLIIKDLPKYTSLPCIIMDLGSTKAKIVEAYDKLPENFHPIGGHPICGKENLSLVNSDRNLYFEAPFILTPLPRTSHKALNAAKQVIQAIGAKLIVMNAVEHDQLLAATSHLPFILASALVLATPDNVSEIIGPGFQSASRLAGTPASMMLGVIMTNRDKILAALERFQDELSIILSSIAENDSESLMNSLNSAQNKYADLMKKN